MRRYHTSACDLGSSADVNGARAGSRKAATAASKRQGMSKGEKQQVRVLVATLKPGETTPFHSHRFPVTGQPMTTAWV